MIPKLNRHSKEITISIINFEKVSSLAFSNLNTNTLKFSDAKEFSESSTINLSISLGKDTIEQIAGSKEPLTKAEMAKVVADSKAIKREVIAKNAKYNDSVFGTKDASGYSLGVNYETRSYGEAAKGEIVGNDIRNFEYVYDSPWDNQNMPDNMENLANTQ